MTVDISSIKDTKIREAARQADSNSKNAYNGVLDKDEVSVFIEQAKKAGCNMSEVKALAQQVGMDKATAQNVNKTMKKAQLEKTITAKKKLLQEKMKQYESMEVKPTTGQYVGRAVGRAVGGIATAGLAVSSVLTTLSGPVGWAVAGLAAATCWLPGYIFGDAIARPDEESYEYKVKANEVKRQKQEYDRKEIEPLYAEIERLERELASLE